MKRLEVRKTLKITQMSLTHSHPETMHNKTLLSYNKIKVSPPQAPSKLKKRSMPLIFRLRIGTTRKHNQSFKALT